MTVPPQLKNYFSYCKMLFRILFVSSVFPRMWLWTLPCEDICMFYDIDVFLYYSHHALLHNACMVFEIYDMESIFLVSSNVFGKCNWFNSLNPNLSEVHFSENRLFFPSDDIGIKICCCYHIHRTYNQRKHRAWTLYLAPRPGLWIPDTYM